MLTDSSNIFPHRFTKIFSKIMPKQVSKLAVAVSGGADSMCLTLLLARLFPEIELHALIVDHGLRTESAHEAQSVRKQLEGHGIKTEILTWHGEKPKANIHATARRERYRLLLKYCHEHKITYLATAHHMDDQAETVLMRLLRGSGIDGLCAITEKTEMDGVSIIRPLLHFRKHDLENYLRQNNITWVVDASNFDTKKFDRANIRNIMQHLPENAPERLALVADNMQRAKTHIMGNVTKFINQCVEFHEIGICLVRISDLLDLDEEILLRVLKTILATISSKEAEDIRLTSLQRLAMAIGSGACSQTLHGCKLLTRQGWLVVRPEETSSIGPAIRRNILATFQDKRLRTSDIYHIPINSAPGNGSRL
jgi:tRNA(Ile)-lysidine synthase